MRNTVFMQLLSIQSFVVRASAEGDPDTIWSLLDVKDQEVSVQNNLDKIQRLFAFTTRGKMFFCFSASAMHWRLLPASFFSGWLSARRMARAEPALTIQTQQTLTKQGELASFLYFPFQKRIPLYSITVTYISPFSFSVFERRRTSHLLSLNWLTSVYVTWGRKFVTRC